MSEAFERARLGQMAVGREQADALDAFRTGRTNRAAGNALQSGDYAGASSALFQGGDLQGGIAVQNAGREQATATRDRQKAAIAGAVSGLLHVPEAQRGQMLQERIAPLFQELGMGEYLSQIRPEHLTDASLRALTVSMGGEVPSAPSGYRHGAAGSLEYIPGGPEDPKNQRPIVTPYGIMMPPGAALPQMPGSGEPQGQPQEGEIVRQLPPGVVPFNQAPRAPAARGAERNQTPSVSFRSSNEAAGQVRQMVPGVNVTNADRTPDDTARLRRQGYKPSDTSFHLRGQALDLTPPRGMTMAQLEAKMREAGFRVLNEGHHIHVSW